MPTKMRRFLMCRSFDRPAEHAMSERRGLVVVADDYGIGPESSRGILELGMEGRLSATVLLVNSPYAEPAVESWRRAGRPVALGWHANLTLDAPLLPAEQVPSLVGPDGRFWPLSAFLGRVLLGKLRPSEVAAELTAQWHRYVNLVGRHPPLVNTHHHVALFPPVGDSLIDLLSRQSPLPFFRRVQEPAAVLWAVPGARFKRSVLAILGRRFARRTQRLGFPGSDYVLGTADPRCLRDDAFWTRWLKQVPGRNVELVCHPGYLDPTLAGRACRLGDGQAERRVRELQLLRRGSFTEARRAAGFQIMRPSSMDEWSSRAA
jgi:predicted glycoside hydrolase/deacetylase ChbG (UPF0249 family)